MKMQGKCKRLLSMFLAVVMCMTFIPWTALAAEGDTATYQKISTMNELTTGQYLMAVSTGYAPTALEGTWVTAESLTLDGNTATGGSAWTITVDGETVKLTDKNGVSIAPAGGNTNGIKAGDYSWAVSCADGAFVFQGQGDDTVTLASNKGSQNKFRAYKNATVSSMAASYPSQFTLYKYAGQTTTPDPKPDPKPTDITAMTPAVTGEVKAGSAVHFALEGVEEELTWQVSTDNTTWADVENPYTIPEGTVGENTLYVRAKLGEQVSLAAELKYTVEAPQEPAGQTATLVTDRAALAAGDKVVIVAANADMALSTLQNKNNRGQAEVSKDGSTVTFGDDTQVFTLGAGTQDGTLAFAVDDGYLCAASSSANYLRTEQTLSDNSSWTVEIDASGVATVKAQGSYTRNWLRHNSGNKIFACYASGQNDIAIYKLGGSTVPEEKPAWENEPAKYAIYDAVTELKDGDTVVLYNGGNGKLLSSTFNSYYLAGEDAAPAEAGYIATEAQNVSWTVSVKQSNGVKEYTFTQGDKTLGILQSGNYFNLKTDSGETGFTMVETAEGSGLYYIYSSTLTGNNGNVYLEWYASRNGFSPYCVGEAKLTEKDFGFGMYKLVREGEKVTEPEEPDDVVTIATALAGDNGAQFKVKGVVTLVEAQNIYVQDATGGICARMNTAASDISLGDTIIATGVRGTYNGTPQLNSAAYVKSTGLTLAAKDTTITALTAADICTYVKLTGLEVTDIYDNNGVYANPNITMKDAEGNTIQLYKAVTTKTDGVWDIQVGDKLDVLAAVGVYQKNNEGTMTFQLRNTLPAEITKTTGTEEPAAGIADGDYVIWAPAYNMALSSAKAGFYNAGVQVEAAGESVTGYGASEVWTVTNQADGTITIAQNGKKLGMADTQQSMDLDAVNDTWKLIPLENGLYNVQNVVRGNCMEWYAKYSNWSTYNSSSAATDGQFQIRFTPAESRTVTDSSVTQGIAKWGGAYSEEAAAQLQAYGDKYVSGDKLDTQAIMTVVANGTQISPYYKPGTNGYMGGQNVGAKQGDYVQMAVNTAGWGDMDLTFRLRSTNAGPGSFQLCYSTDGGTTWKNFTTGSYAYAYTGWNSEGSYPVTGEGKITDGIAKTSLSPGEYIGFAFDVPKGAENCENLLIRLVPGTERASGTGAVGGNIRIDSVVLSGSPIVDGAITSHVTVTPDGTEDQAIGTALDMKSEDGAVIYYRVNSGEWKTYDPENQPTLEALPTILEVYAKAEGKAQSVTLTYNYAAGTVASVKMDPNGGGVYIPGESKTITLSCATDGAEVYYMTSEDGEVWPEEWTTYAEPIVLNKGFGKLYVRAYAVKAGFTDSPVAERFFTERSTDTYGLYFGQLHSHTNYSDGAGTCEEAFQHASGVDQIDFLAVTDHSNSFDNADKASLTDGSMSSEWIEGHELAEKYTTDTFVGLYGYEMTWSNGLGHINTFNTPGFQSRTQAAYTTYGTALQNYYDALKQVSSSISQFNHPGTTFGDFSDFAHFDDTIDERITLIEVGNGEGAIGSSGYFPSYEYYTRALDKGWHVAPTNNQDNHKGNWGNSNTGRSVVMSDSLTAEGIYDAMRNYRVYATEDNDLRIYYSLNNNPMGSILDLETNDDLTLSVRLSDPTDAAIGKVEVIVNGGLTAASETVTTSSATVSFALKNTYSYYYIKVTQPDGDIAVTAPVWTGDVEAVGISKFETDAALPVQGQEMNLTLELYNNEKTPFLINKVEFSVGGKVIHTASGLDRVDKQSTASYSFPYTHSGLGKTEIVATVTGTMGGVEKVYSEKLPLTYVTSGMVTRVVVDGTHYNDYVSGYYGGNMNNLTAIAAGSQIEVKVVTDQITAETLADCDLLIVSAPARNSGTANAGDYTAKPFEDSFLTLVKDYVDNGGSVVVCGLADYQDKKADSRDYHTSAQLNKLLEAIGSTMRINDDEAMDDENNGGQAYRLYPATFNTDAKWCAGIQEGQTYSQYSGCTVSVGNGTWLVKGFDTTYSIDSDNDGIGGVGKGEAVFLAAEQTAKGGNIFAAGGVFVSDFEVKAELDNIWDLPYANRTIIENILGAVRVELPLSTVADVRAGKQDEVFRIRGYVTAGTDNEFNKFFDAIYVQDETGGITVFPFAALGVAIGTPIELIGYVDAYQGDKEIQIMDYKILDGEPKIYQPAKMSNKDAMDYDKNGGKLIQVEGEVVDVIYSGETGVAQFVVKDSKGDLAKVFIDGYILSGTTGKNELASFVKKGNIVSGVGLLYKHPEGDSEESVAVLRVRNCDEIKLVKEGTPATDPTKPSETTPSDPTTKPTEKPTKPTKPGSGSAVTGDNSMIGLMVLVMFSTGLVLAVLLMKRKRILKG